MMNNTKKKRLSISFFNEYRAYLFLILILILGAFAKNFYTLFNIRSILNSTVLYAFIGIGFTLCMIAGHMDLSVGYMSTTGAVVVLGMHTLSKLPWIWSLLIVVGVGAIIGIANGLLVTKAKIHSFIATLGMQFVLKGGMFIYCNGAEISVKGDYGLTDALAYNIPHTPFSVIFLITIAMVIVFSVMLTSTRFGRNIHIMGGNLESAWLAGINSDRITNLVFMLSAIVCALGGALFGIYQATATPTTGEKGISPLMVALTATIIGGTDVHGGKGNVINTFVATLAIQAMFSALTSLIGKYEMQILLMGLVLAACVVYETLGEYKRQKMVGARPNLMIEYLQEKMPNR